MSTLVSILICTRNRAAQLQQTLASVARLNVPEHLRAELILVDNGSDDNTLAVMQAFHPPNMLVHVVEERKPGKATACNAGIRASRGAIILTTDDDVRFPPDWISTMCAPILSGEADAVAGGVVLAPHLRRPWMQQPEFSFTMGTTATISNEHPGRMLGANMAFSRKVLEKVPMFDPELGPGMLGFEEDTLFSLQLLKAGYRIVSAFDPPVEHHYDAARLSRSSCLHTAEKLGRASGYIDHHWRHLHKDTWKGHRVWPYLVLIKAYVDLMFKRIARWKDCRSPEGIQRWEMLSVWRLYRAKQLIQEQKRPRNYDRYGLVKKTIRNELVFGANPTPSVAPQT